MDLGLRDRVAIVTGGASGIGAAVVAELAREGCDVALVDRLPLEEAAAALAPVAEANRQGRAWVADVRDFALAERTVADVVRTFGRLDVLVCCAGVTDDALSWRMSEEQWDRVLDVNLKGCFNWTRAAAAVLKDRRWGRIVTVASINGLRGKFGQANYAASKGGVVALSKSLARELGKFGVTVNVLAPGMVLTEMTRGLPADVLERATDESALGALATAADCAAAVAYLCSARAAHVTGHVLQVDGGQYL